MFFFKENTKLSLLNIGYNRMFTTFTSNTLSWPCLIFIWSQWTDPVDNRQPEKKQLDTIEKDCHWDKIGNRPAIWCRIRSFRVTVKAFSQMPRYLTWKKLHSLVEWYKPTQKYPSYDTKLYLMASPLFWSLWGCRENNHCNYSQLQSYAEWYYRFKSHLLTK